MASPTLTDALNQIAALQASMAALTKRVAAVESTADSNKARLDALDHFKDSHSAGAVERQQEIDQLRAESQRVRWSVAHGRHL